MYNPDELMHMSIANTPSLSEMWQRSLLETHPPLGHALRFFTLKLSDAFVFERVVTLVFGMLTIPAFFFIGYTLGGNRAGLFMAFICSFSPMAIAIAQEVRNYSLFLMLATFAFYAYLRYREAGERKWLARYILLLALACMTHFSGFLLGFILGLDAAWQARHSSKRFITLVIAHLPMLVLTLLSYHFFYAEGTATAGWKAHYLATGKRFALDPASHFGELLLFFDLFGLSSHLTQLIPAGLSAEQRSMVENVIYTLILGGMGFWYAVAVLETRRRATRHLPLIIAFWVVSQVLALLLIYPFSFTRHNAYALMLFAVPLALHISLVRTHHDTRIAIIAILAMTALCLCMAQENIHKWRKSLSRDDYVAALALVKTTVPEDEPIITNRFTSLYIDYTLDRNARFYHAPAPLRARELAGNTYVTDPRIYYWDFTTKNLDTLLDVTRASFPKAEHIWFLYYDVYGWDLKPYHACLKTRGDIIQDEGQDARIRLFAVDRDVATGCRAGKGKH